METAPSWNKIGAVYHGSVSGSDGSYIMLSGQVVEYIFMGGNSFQMSLALTFSKGSTEGAFESCQQVALVSIDSYNLAKSSTFTFWDTAAAVEDIMGSDIRYVQCTNEAAIVSKLMEGMINYF